MTIVQSARVAHGIIYILVRH